jgi:hypothetical protein
MPAVIIAGLPIDADRRVRSTLKQRNPLPAEWQLIWLRSNGRVPGLTPGQLGSAWDVATTSGGAHFLIFRGRDRGDENFVIKEIAPYFRVRWLDGILLKLIPHRIDDWFRAIRGVLDEEIEWIETVKPQDVSCCLLLPECAFAPSSAVRHVWSAATESGIERIRLAARAVNRFHDLHWHPTKNGARGWIDTENRFFDHRGPLHGLAPFPRSWKYSYRVADGFHYDVTSKLSRAFHVNSADGNRHGASGAAHINIDPHGYVR